MGHLALTGIEPISLETRTPLHLRSAPFGELPQVSVRVGRIELPTRPYQGHVIPFNYTRMVDEQVFVQRDFTRNPPRPIKWTRRDSNPDRLCCRQR